MKYLIFFILMICCFGIQSQREVNRIKYKGDSVYVYPLMMMSSMYERIPFLIDSLPDGKYIIYRNSNKHRIAGEFNISNGKINGKATRYNFKGHKSAIETYSNSLLQGEKAYFDAQGNLRTTEEYQLDRLNGEVKHYYESGVLRAKCLMFTQYIEGAGDEPFIHGEYLSYHKNKQLMAKFYLDTMNSRKNNIENYEPLFTDQTTMDEKLFADFHKNLSHPYGATKKEWKKYYSRGAIVQHAFFLNKIPFKYIQGKATVWFHNGNVCFEGEYKDSSLHIYQMNDLSGRSLYEVRSTPRDGVIHHQYASRSFYSREPFAIDFVEIPKDSVVWLRRREWNYKSELDYEIKNPSKYRYLYEDTIDEWFVTKVKLRKNVLDTLQKENVKTGEVISKVKGCYISIDSSRNCLIKDGSGVEISFSNEGHSFSLLRDHFPKVNEKKTNREPFLKVNGVPYSGTLKFKQKGRREPFHFKVKKEEITWFGNEIKRGGYHPYSNEFHFVNGRLDGSHHHQKMFYDYSNGELIKEKQFDNSGRIIADYTYSDGRANGYNLIYRDYDIDLYKDKQGKVASEYERDYIDEKNSKKKTFKGSYVKNSCLYRDGNKVLEKRFEIPDYFDVTMDSLFDLKRKRDILFTIDDAIGAPGLVNSTSYELDGDSNVVADIKLMRNGVIVSERGELNQRLHGKAIGYYWGERDTNYIVNFNDGYLHGNYIFGMEGTNEEKGQFYKGCQVGEWIYQGDEQVLLNVKFKDTVNIKRRIYYNYEFYGGWALSRFQMESINGLKRDMDVVYYYPNSNKLQEGSLVKGKRVGHWKFYNKEGWLKEEHFYGVDSILNTIGFFKEYDKEGSLKAKGGLFEGDYQYNCDAHHSVEESEKNYLLYINSNGDTLINDGKGYVKVESETGALKSEGQIKNGLKTGIWKYYSREGGLKGYGKYIEGKKDGVWLKGDLQGVPVDDETCHSSNYNFRSWSGDIKIRISLFDNGELISEKFSDTNVVKQ